MWSFFSWRWKQYIHTTQNFPSRYLWENGQAAASFLSLKKNLHKNFSMWKVIIEWMFIAIFINLQFYTQTGNNFFKTGICSKTSTLMKLKKNLVTIPSRLWTRYLIKIIYMWRFALTWHCIDITLHWHIPGRSVQQTKLLKLITTNTLILISFSVLSSSVIIFIRKVWTGIICP